HAPPPRPPAATSVCGGGKRCPPPSRPSPPMTPLAEPSSGRGDGNDAAEGCKGHSSLVDGAVRRRLRQERLRRCAATARVITAARGDGRSGESEARRSKESRGGNGGESVGASASPPSSPFKPTMERG